MTDLVRSDRLDGDLETLRAHVAALNARLDERSADITRLKTDLDAFRISYRQRVGLLHERLDELELAIAEAELGELSKRMDSDAGDSRGTTIEPGPAPPSQYKSDAVRALFREVAKAIHPNLAHDDEARDSRHALMVEANRAYALGDELQLRSILQTWARSPEAVRGTDSEATRVRLGRRLEQLEAHLARLAADLETLQASALWQLKTMVDQAAATGKDLVAEMVARLERDIMIATNYLEAIRPPRP